MHTGNVLRRKKGMEELFEIIMTKLILDPKPWIQETQES